MSVCIHGNLCREIYKKTGYIHSRTCPSNCKYFEELSQEPTTKNDLIDNKLALLEKTYTDFCNCEGGDGWLKIDGKEYTTDVGYAIEGMGIFVEVLKQRLAKSEVTE